MTPRRPHTLGIFDEPENAGLRGLAAAVILSVLIWALIIGIVVWCWPELVASL